MKTLAATLTLAILSTSGSALQSEVIVLRSGQVGGAPGAVPTEDFVTSPDDCLTYVMSTGPISDSALTTADFQAASSGLSAVLVEPNPAWVDELSCDPDARWVNWGHGTVGPDGSGLAGSALYACEFTVESTCANPTGRVELCFAVDNRLGENANDPNPIGAFINGVPLGTEFAGGGFGSETTVVKTGVPLRSGSNRLYLYQLDFGGVAGILYHCKITVDDSCCIPPPEDMVGWWPLDEDVGSPDEAADLAYHNTGTHVGPLASVAQYVDRSLVFDGSSTWVSVPDHPILDIGEAPAGDQNDFSADAWINPFVLQPEATILSKIGQADEPFTNPAAGYHFFLQGDQLALTLSQGTGLTQTHLSTPIPGIPDGEWHCVAFTVDRGQGVKFYFDGALLGTVLPQVPIPGYLDNDGPFVIGARTGGSVFHGGIDEVEFFRRVLEHSEVLAIYEARSDGKCKEYCFVEDALYWLNESTSEKVDLLVHNGTPEDHTYTIDLLPVADGGDDCDLTGPELNFGSVQIEARSSFQTKITVPIPPGLDPFETACYEVRITNEDTGETFSCILKLRTTDTVPQGCAGDVSTGGTGTGVGGVSLIDFALLNTGAATWIGDLEVSPATELQGGGVGLPGDVALDGNAPGLPVVGSFSIPPFGTETVSVAATVVEHTPFAVQTVTLKLDLDGDGTLEPAATALFETAPPPDVVGSIDPYGCGQNPAGSLSLSGTPQIGDLLDFAIDNPLGTQGVGSLSLLMASVTPLGLPCGIPVPGFHMDPGTPTGELLVAPGGENPLFVGGLWGGPGSPASVPVPIPAQEALVGAAVYFQGLLFDPVAAGGVTVGLTEGRVVTLGG